MIPPIKKDNLSFISAIARKVETVKNIPPIYTQTFDIDLYTLDYEYPFSNDHLGNQNAKTVKHPLYCIAVTFNHFTKKCAVIFILQNLSQKGYFKDQWYSGCIIHRLERQAWTTMLQFWSLPTYSHTNTPTSPPHFHFSPSAFLTWELVEK